MASDQENDFRHAAAKATIELLARQRLSNPLNSETSCCAAVPGNAIRSLYRVALAPWMVTVPALLLVLSAFVVAILIPTPWVDLNLKTIGVVLACLVLGILLLAISFRIGHGVFDRAVQGWNSASMIKDLESRVAECHRFAVEDPRTYTKQKTISEDYARGGLERSGQGILLLGCQYTYVIRTKDITDFRQDKSTFLVSFRVGSSALSMAVSPFIEGDEAEKRFWEVLRAKFGKPNLGEYQLCTGQLFLTSTSVDAFSRV